jgi:hypothetical protein
MIPDSDSFTSFRVCFVLLLHEHGIDNRCISDSSLWKYESTLNTMILYITETFFFPMKICKKVKLNEVCTCVNDSQTVNRQR